MSWVRRRLLTGFFVSVPLIISVAALMWIFGIIGSLTAPLAVGWIGNDEPQGVQRLMVGAVGVLATVALVFAVGVVATNAGFKGAKTRVRSL